MPDRMKNCRCGDYCRVVSFDDNDNNLEYGVECNNPDCEHWNDEDYPELARTEEEAVRLWNAWVDNGTSTPLLSKPHTKR